MSNKPASGSGIDIYQLLLEASKKRERRRKKELLRSIGVKEYFDEGSIRIDMNTCKGIECKLCIEACPTNALYWRAGEVGIVKELCVFCAACVWSCVVDDCVQVSRKRPNREIERFGTPREVLMLLRNINSKKRVERLKSRFPDIETFLRRYGK